MTPAHDTPVLVRREQDLARRRLDAGDPAGAHQAARQSLNRLAPGPERVDTLLLLSTIDQERAEIAAGRAWLDQALQEACDDRAALARAHLMAGMAGWTDVDDERSHAVAAISALDGREAEDPTSAATALVLLAGTDFEAGHGLRVELLDRAVALEPATDLVAMMRPSTQRAIFLGHAGRLAEALPAIGACVTRAEHDGDQTTRPHLLRTLAWMELGHGELRRAHEHIDQAIALREDLALDDAYIWAVAAQIQAARGAGDPAQDLADRAITRAQQSGNPWAEIRARAAAGFAHLTADRPTPAAEELSAADALGRAGRLVEIGWHRMHGDLVEALVGAGRIEPARAALQSFLDRAELTGHPWSVAVSARSAGFVALADGRLDDAVDHFERCLAAPLVEQYPFERARALVGLGASLRRANRRRDARAALEAAVHAFVDMGSEPWAGKARYELAAVSGRVAAGAEELTTMQRRVAVLAGMGRTNAEIARELFLSVRTVETHLAAVYRKLGARSRTELAYFTIVAE
jgi:DNA-binding CsgD family transcriptional regulator